MNQKETQGITGTEQQGAGSLSSTEVYALPVAERYDALIMKEDHAKNIDYFLGNVIADGSGALQLDVLDLGAGTGRLSCMAAPYVRSITALDASEGMLKQAAMKLAGTGLQQVHIQVADLRGRLPLEDQSVDLVMAGWSICYVASENHPQHESYLKALMQEIRRVLRPSGKVMILETLGTGNAQPEPATFLADYMRVLEEEYHLTKTILDTSFKFDSVEQAEVLCRDFFGDAVGDWIEREQSLVVPSWTGIWLGEL
ncbi:class I SAM-dependent methyltransferase [Paenibacillus guangzhouensis]|uniref:class I SAM-dependent methyltransferase n=1 Tax=Paenibacillus guangzhouensis TaxID=1473112 RepID=UPI0012675813|nr:class I SAM-dependent methyltransferase [Paenibacillus guangzhouensis]